jgi:iron(III) transport system substrate-binding protein
MIKKRGFLFVLTAILAFNLVGCGSTSNGESSSKKKSLVVYSNSVSDGRGEWLKKKAAEKGFDIQIVDGGGGEIANRLVAEKNNPIADVIFGLNTMEFVNLKNQELLEQHKPAWASQVTEGLNDRDGYYHSIVKQAILLIYNSELYDENTAPKDWSDLWKNKEFHSKYSAPKSLGGGTNRAVIAGILVRYQDPNGEYGISDEGWKEIGEFFEYGYYLPEGEDFYANLANGKSPIGPMWSSGIATREKDFGVKAGIVKPQIGVPYVVEQVAIIKGSKKLEAAKEFVDWFGGAEVQTEWSKEFSSMPANEEALKNTSQDIKDLEKSLSQQEIDWSFVAKNINQWAEKIELELLP